MSGTPNSRCNLHADSLTGEREITGSHDVEQKSQRTSNLTLVIAKSKTALYPRKVYFNNII